MLHKRASTASAPTWLLHTKSRNATTMSARVRAVMTRPELSCSVLSLATVASCFRPRLRPHPTCGKSCHTHITPSTMHVAWRHGGSTLPVAAIGGLGDHTLRRAPQKTHPWIPHQRTPQSTTPTHNSTPRACAQGCLRSRRHEAHAAYPHQNKSEHDSAEARVGRQDTTRRRPGTQSTQTPTLTAPKCHQLPV